MAFLRVEKKKSGNYMRIVEAYRVNGRPKQRTLHSLGKVEDYPTHQLESIAKKLLELAGLKMEDIVAESFHETNRLNYGYALVIKKLWKLFNFDTLVKKINRKSKVKFDWINILQLMIAERINEPASKRQNFFNTDEYLGFNDKKVALQYFYRTLDILANNQNLIKEHIFEQQQNLFTQQLDVVFYDVTTLYFDSQAERPDSLAQKGFSKDGKAHKTQVVLGLLVDKLRNPVTYNIYKGNTYEGYTMLDAINQFKKQYPIDKCVVVADSAMIDKDNRKLLEDNKIHYIIGDRIKSLPGKIKEQLIDKTNHKEINKDISKSNLSYTETEYQDRRIICTYSEKRAKKDTYNRQKLLEKAKYWVSNPSKYKQTKKRGAGRYINLDEDKKPAELNMEQIEKDAQYDGFKAIATNMKGISVAELLSKYSDLFEVEHAFRTLKSQLEIRPMFHWTDKRIEGHIAMCFMAYAFLNYLRNITELQYKDIIKTLDRMQMSEIKEDGSDELIYMRLSIDKNQKLLSKKSKLVMPNDITTQKAINQLFM